MQLSRNNVGVDEFTTLRLLLYNHLEEDEKEMLVKADEIYASKNTSFADEWEAAEDDKDLRRRLDDIADGDPETLLTLMTGLVVIVKLLKMTT